MKKYIICLLLLIVTPTISIAEDKEFALEIKDTKMDFIKNGDILTVYVVGKFVNKQQYPIKDIVIESQFFDKNGDLIDVATEELYSNIVPANGEAAFKIFTHATKDREVYTNYKINILSSTQEEPCVSKKSKLSDNGFTQMLGIWAPILFITVVFLWLTRKYAGKNSPQQRRFLLVEKQNELFAQQNAYLKSIAESIKNKQQ